MARKLIDISVPLQNDVPADPPGGHPTIQYIDHQQGLPRMLQFFDGLKAEDLPDGQGWAVEQVQLHRPGKISALAHVTIMPQMVAGAGECTGRWCVADRLPGGQVAKHAKVMAN